VQIDFLEGALFVSQTRLPTVTMLAGAVAWTVCRRTSVQLQMLMMLGGDAVG
jgi:hypothetical protein